MRILLLDEGFPGSAYTAVSLRDAGAEVRVLAGTGGRGEYAEPGLRWALGPRVGSAEYLAAVERAVETEAIDRVFAITEPVLYRLWDAAPAWEERVVPATEEWQRRLLRSKAAMSAHVAEHGVAIPRQVRLRTAADAEGAAAALGLPLVVKGETGRGGTSTVVARSAGEAGEAAGRMGGEAFAQEFVAGNTSLVGGLWHRGEPLRLFAGEKLAQQPRGTGPAVHLRSVADPALLEAGRAVFRALEWTGIASADFIRRPDGAYAFLEVNPRPWGSISALEAAGVDVWRPFLSLLEGRVPAPDLAFRAGVETTVFPLWLLHPEYGRRPGALLRLARDLRGPQGKVWRRPGRVLHLINRIRQVRRNWERGSPES